MRVKQRQQRNALREKVFSNTFNVASLFDQDDELRLMRKPFLKPEFTDRFSRGVRFYKQGAWKRAREELEQIEKIIKKKDPPTRSLLAYMSEYNY